MNCNPHRRGKLYFRYGTMGSAKTAILLTTAYNFEERGLDYLCMKPIVDNREKDSVIRSRIGIERKCRWIFPESDMYRMLVDIFEAEGLKATVYAPTFRATSSMGRVAFLKLRTPSTK